MKETKYIIIPKWYSEMTYYIGEDITSYNFHIDKNGLFLDKLRKHMIDDDNFRFAYTLSEANAIMKKWKRYRERFGKPGYDIKGWHLVKVSKLRKLNKNIK